MKRGFFLFLLTFIIMVYGFAQNNLTPDQIRRYANELGIPYEALQRLIDSHRTQTGLTNPNASGARVLSVQEFAFMRESNMLEIGSYYRIRARFSNQSGRTVFLYGISPDSGYLAPDVSFLVNIAQNTPVDVLIGVQDYYGRPIGLSLVEIVEAR
jgi:hypothetical protein